MPRNLVEVLNSLKVGLKCFKEYVLCEEETDNWESWTLDNVFLEKEKLSFQHAISKYVSEHNFPLDLVLNLDQIPLSYVWPCIYTFDLKGSTPVPITDVNDKWQLTVTFKPFASSSFLPFNSSIMVKPSIVYPHKISLIALMLHSLQIVGPTLKRVPVCQIKLPFRVLKSKERRT